MSKKLTKEYIENFVKENSKCELIEIIRKLFKIIFSSVINIIGVHTIRNGIFGQCFRRN